MYVQFFPDYKETATSPLTLKEGSLWLYELDYDPLTEDPVLVDGVVQIVNISLDPGIEVTPE